MKTSVLHLTTPIKILILIFFSSVVHAQVDVIEEYTAIGVNGTSRVNNDHYMVSIAKYNEGCHTGGTAVLDFVSGHSVNLADPGAIPDEAIVLTNIFTDPECDGVPGNQTMAWDPFVIDIRKPGAEDDPEELPDNDFEILYDLTVDENNHVIGVGTFSEKEWCGTPLQVPHYLTWPFYFKYDPLNDNLIYFKRLISPVGDCDLNPIEETPVDVEILNEDAFVISMYRQRPNSNNGGLIKVDKANGNIIDTKRYLDFNPKDIEIVNEKVYAVGQSNGNLRTGDISILAVDNNLNPLTIRFLMINDNNSIPEVSAIRYNPETASLLIVGNSVPDGPGGNFVIRIGDLVNLTPSWQRKIGAITTHESGNWIYFFHTYGLEYLRDKDAFVFHSLGAEHNPLMGIDRLTHYLTTIDDATGNDIDIVALSDGIDFPDNSNFIPTNSTLVQSSNTNHLEWSIPFEKDAASWKQLGLFRTKRYYEQNPDKDCMENMTPNSFEQSNSLPFFSVTLPYDVTAESFTPKIIRRYVSFEEECSVASPQDNKRGVKSASITNDLDDDLPDFTILPNPASSEVRLGMVDDYLIIDSRGSLILKVEGVNVIDISALMPGTYFIRNSQGRSKMFVVQ